MRVSFDSSEKTLRIPFGTPQVISFHDKEANYCTRCGTKLR